MQSVMELLEQRQFLSVSPVLDAPDVPAIHAPLAAAATPVLKVVGSFIGTVRVDGPSANFTLRILTQTGTKVTARLYSPDWGGFDVNLSGTLKGTKLTLAGKNATIQVKRFTAVVAPRAAKLDVNFVGVQMGIPTSGKVQLSKVKKAPALVLPKVPKMASKYVGHANPGNNEITLLVTRQEGGHLWVTVRDPEGDQRLTGVILKNRGFHLVGRSPDGTLEIDGQVQGDGSLVGEWEFDDRAGHHESGTWNALPD